MAHLTENSKKLKRIDINVNNLIDLNKISVSIDDIFCISIPFFLKINNYLLSIKDNIQNLLNKIDLNSVMFILCSPEQAVEIFLQLKPSLKLQLWIAIKLEESIIKTNYLSSDHAALLVLSKYQGSLKHTKTRIGYSYCPFCDKTTKDYGGKKHLYHEFGTLLSDVWRDITYKPGFYPDEILTRLQDLFGIEPYSYLKFIDLKNVFNNQINDVKIKYSLSLQDNTQIINNSKLINQDCLIALKDIPDNSVDFCFADPPYNIQKKYDSWDDSLDIKEYFIWCDKWLYELGRVLKPGRICAILNIPIWVIRHYSYMKKTLKFFDWIVWEGLSLPVRMIMPSHYSILTFSKGNPRELPGFIRTEHSPLEFSALQTYKQNYCTRNFCIDSREKSGENDKQIITNLWWDIHRLKHNSRRVDHPTQLPPKLMYRLISLFTFENELVLDPFNGSGTTSLSAEQLNRKFIGIELSEYYHQIAIKRHNDLRNEIDPFRKNGDTPKAKNSRVKRLPKQKYTISKKTLQLEIKRIAKILGKIPTKDEVKEHSKFPFNFYEEYFIDWGEACAAARTTGMTESKKKISSTANLGEQLNIF